MLSLVSWLRHPYKNNKAQVTVNRLRGWEFVLLFALSVLVSIAFYFILRRFNTAELVLSTVSVLTSFFAASLTFRRSAFMSLAYAANDAVLIALWTPVCVRDWSYLSVLSCFVVFFANDLYGFYSLRKMQKSQCAR